MMTTTTRSGAEDTTTPVTNSLAIVVPHTHWDREWHSPFSTMRFHLVGLLDELMSVLEGEPELPAFLLDGQAVLLEDYLEVRPDQRERLTSLVRAGRLRPGPFYVQPDEFLVSGESIVRNVLLGLEAASSCGGTMREGYLPDTFGHVHQLPQVLRGFGIPTFFAMRGLGTDLERLGSEFWWESPDGSRVRAHALVESYSNAAVLTGTPETTRLHHGTLVRYDSLQELLERLSRWSHTGVLLLLNGGDHLRVQGDLPRLVGSLDDGLDLNLVLGTLEDYRRAVEARPDDLATHRGELRAGRYHDVFEDVTSTRTYLKRWNDDAETALLVAAERLDAVMTLLTGRSHRDHLRGAWRELLKNHAHDSITGCSVDVVHEEMRGRFLQASQVAEVVAEDCLRRLTTTVALPTAEDEVPLVVVNPSPWQRTGAVRVGVLADLHPPLGQRRFGWRQEDQVSWSHYALLDDEGRTVPFTVGERELGVEDVLDRRKELWRDVVHFVAWDVPPLGWRTFRLVPRDRATVNPSPESRTGEDHVGRAALENEHLRVVVADDGTLEITDKHTGVTAQGLGELIDEGDAGDEYNAAPLADGVVRSTDLVWEVLAGQEPHAVQLKGELLLPESRSEEPQQRAGSLVPCPATVRVTLPPGARFVRLDMTMLNRARDHRLRARFPFPRALAEPEGCVLAESAFGAVNRGADAPDATGWKERPAGSFAMRRFVAVEDAPTGWAVLTHGLHEYARAGDGALLVTLLRAVGQLSRDDIPARPHPAGPPIATPGAQCLGEQRMTYALMPFSSRDGHGTLFRAAEELCAPLLARAQQPPTLTGAAEDRLLPESFLRVEPAAVVLTAFKAAAHDDGVVARVVNTGDQPVEARLTSGLAIVSAGCVGLDELPGTSPGREGVDTPPTTLGRDGAVSLALRPGQIATVRIATVKPSEE
jgi:mannosylglycerate hydrolase